MANSSQIKDYVPEEMKKPYHARDKAHDAHIARARSPAGC
jgi:hypothetical protein